jgi:hypothetical protein
VPTTTIPSASLAQQRPAPDVRRVRGRRARERAEREDLARQPRRAQTDEGTERVLRPAQVENARPEGEQAGGEGDDRVVGARGRQLRKQPPQQELDGERPHRQLRQHQHEHQRQVRMAGAHLVEVGGQQVARERALGDVLRRRHRDRG